MLRVVMTTAWCSLVILPEILLSWVYNQMSCRLEFSNLYFRHHLKYSHIAILDIVLAFVKTLALYSALISPQHRDQCCDILTNSQGHGMQINTILMSPSSGPQPSSNNHRAHE